MRDLFWFRRFLSTSPSLPRSSLACPSTRQAVLVRVAEGISCLFAAVPCTGANHRSDVPMRLSCSNALRAVNLK